MNTGLKDFIGNEVNVGNKVMMNNNDFDLAEICFGEFGVRDLATGEIVDTVIGFYLRTIETDETSKIEPFCRDVQLNKNIIQYTKLKVIK